MMVRSHALTTLLLFATAAPLAEAWAAETPADLVSRLSLEEKAAQLQSAAPPIPRLGIRGYEWWNEGLHGLARNGPATVFPQAIGLAATWDEGLMGRVGEAVSTEARAKFNAVGDRDPGRYEGLTIWSPNINIYRDPRWGRGQETYGEDPHLTGTLAAAFVRGIQGPDPQHPRAIATPKHFAVHSGPEAGRHGFDVDVSPQDLEATYLPAFRQAVVEGGARSVMCAYNAIHGFPACASPLLLDETLRRDWSFKGFVVSDCDAVDDMTQFHYFRLDNAASSAAALVAGDDLNCGNAYAQLPAAVRRGDLDEAMLDRAVVRLFEARAALGALFAPDPANPYARIGADAVNSPAHQALALEAARKSIVLLKNDRKRLPLAATTKIAVIGPDADALEVLEANYHGTAVDPITPLQGLRAQWGKGNIRYAQGSTVAEGVPVAVPETALRTGVGPDAVQGLIGAYFDDPALSGAPRVTRTDRVVNFDWDRAAPAPGLDSTRYGVRWTGALVPPGPGQYALVVGVARCFDCKGHDPVRLWIDDKLVVDDDGSGKAVEAVLNFADARPRRIRLELSHAGEDQGVRLQWRAPAAPQLAEAVKAAAQSDVVVAVVGLSPDVEGEALQVTVPGFDGGDRTDIALPAPQRRLLEALAATGKPLVVVLTSGGAVELDWAKTHADAILAAWYPGQSGGVAIAETLAGLNNPSGRLPVTFYKSARDLPPLVEYAMKGRTYRYFEGEPTYPFGYGLSYTRFDYGAPSVSSATLKAGEDLIVEAQVANVGDRAGDEVVQAYLIPPKPADYRGRQADRLLLRTLVGFDRVTLKPGERRKVRFTLSPRDLSQVARNGARAVVPGQYTLFVGGGQRGQAPGQAVNFTIEGQQELPR
ncbi:glycoside hydrolase family 3 [Caulobacter sp. Root656]|nr:glycoside hydrolase family 3 [Caulobacter sp. Root656]